ncbi:inositol monophosphatase family protein [Compostimonas suwonensis]|uniref:Inositol-1-monophosphatase n=1 Tax=Compostimonas suwonensis TaxID=1048394 RepID=A0A2M9BCW6_9MICO|nr:inositol monophosphatase family protein [Compostimonas suwonensis]PJJ55789.1 myo-inositol-1(or 4)-monophosphatase [Compostimonas suwonensis]
MTTAVNPAELLAIATTIAREAGALVRRRRDEGVEVAASKSSPEDVVTFADRESEDLIRARLAQLRPHDGFLGEESEATGGTSGLTWVVDPIDGTVNYLYDIPAYAVSIAVVEGEPDPASWTALAGAVYNPVLDEMFSASRGGGAFLGDRPLRVSERSELSLALVGTGFGYSAEKRTRQAEVVEGLISQVRDIRRIGSAALDLCSLAAGRLDAYYESGLNPWDIAAGALIASEAGARITGFQGRPAGKELLLGAGPGVFDELERALVELGVVPR